MVFAEDGRRCGGVLVRGADSFRTGLSPMLSQQTCAPCGWGEDGSLQKKKNLHDCGMALSRSHDERYGTVLQVL